MKKVIFLVCIVASLMFLPACLGSAEPEVLEVKSLGFEAEDAQMNSMVKLTIEPIYEKRELRLNYVYAPLDRDEVDPENNSDFENLEDFATDADALIGQEYFDVFEEIVRIYYQENQDQEIGDHGDKELLMIVEEMKGNKEELNIYDEFNVENLQVIENFYKDVVSMFQEETY